MVRAVAANPSDRLAVPASARVARVEPPRVEAQTVAEGLWFLTGGSHNSVAVEFQDFIAVIEAPLNEAQSLAVIGEVRRLAPGKPIRYLINTHHHFDHAGGLRAYAAEGATILTHVSNRRFYDLMFEGARPLSPDRLTASGRHADVEPVAERFLIRNGSRVLEVHWVEGNLHNAGLLMVYLPRERLLVEADAFTPGPPGDPPPALANPFTINLYENVRRLNLDVAQIAPLHGRLVPWVDLLRAIGKQNEATPDEMLRAGR
jgi:glyoxylase-like metal-dependent hydrolase (beta-lactamase superfamily II)